jgi:hypothetical protein
VRRSGRCDHGATLATGRPGAIGHLTRPFCALPHSAGYRLLVTTTIRLVEVLAALSLASDVGMTSRWRSRCATR